MNKYLFSFFLSIVSSFSSFAQINNFEPLYSTQFIKDEISIRLDNMVDFEFDEYGRAWILLTTSRISCPGLRARACARSTSTTYLLLKSLCQKMFQNIV